MIALLAFAAATLAALGCAALVGASLPRGRRPRAGARGPRAIRALAGLGGAAARRAAPRDLERLIAAAGVPGGVEPREAMAAKLAAAVATAPIGALLGTVAPGRLGFALVLAAPVAGFFAPDLWLLRQAARRARVARRQLPELLELLRVTIDAGAPLAAALAAVGARAEGPVAREWRTAGREVELGVSLAEALEAMRRRLPLAEVRALVAALDRARRHGAPLAATLSAQAADARLALRRRVQEDAARAGPKIQLVVALLLVPSVLLMVAAALAAALLDPGGGTPLR